MNLQELKRFLQIPIDFLSSTLDPQYIGQWMGSY